MPTSDNAKKQEKKLEKFSEQLILATWSRALSNEALARRLEDLAQEPKGWKKEQRAMLLLEAAIRIAQLGRTMFDINKAHEEYRRALKERCHRGIAQDQFYRQMMQIMGWEE